MKKSLVALAVLGTFASVASAQSSVTLFGVVDLSALNVTNNGATQRLMMSNSLNSNRLGFRGTEDLGGGMKASFWLEAGMNNDVGSAGTLAPASNAGSTLPTAYAGTKFFNRRSTVSLTGNFGEVRLGRDYTPTFWSTTAFDQFGTNGPGSSLNVSTTGLGTSAGTYVRADNAIAYFLPSGLGGVYGWAQMSLGENSTTTNAWNKQKSVRIGYAAGPVDVAFATGSTDVAGGATFKHTNIGGSYDFGAAKLNGYLSTSKASASGRKEQLFNIGVNVPMGQMELRTSYTRNNQSGTGFDAADASQFAIGLIYNLSKRTALYTDFSRISNGSATTTSAGSSFTVGAGPANVAGGSSRGFDVGLRHAF